MTNRLMHHQQQVSAILGELASYSREFAEIQALMHEPTPPLHEIRAKTDALKTRMARLAADARALDESTGDDLKAMCEQLGMCLDGWLALSEPDGNARGTTHGAG